MLAERAAVRLRLTLRIGMDQDICGGELFKNAPFRRDDDPVRGGQGERRVKLHMHLDVHKRP